MSDVYTAKLWEMGKYVGNDRSHHMWFAKDLLGQ